MKRKSNGNYGNFGHRQNYIALFASSSASVLDCVHAFLSLSCAAVTIILAGSLIIWEATSFTPIHISEQREHYMHEQVRRFAGVRTHSHRYDDSR